MDMFMYLHRLDEKKINQLEQQIIKFEEEEDKKESSENKSNSKEVSLNTSSIDTFIFPSFQSGLIKLHQDSELFINTIKFISTLEN